MASSSLSPFSLLSLPPPRIPKPSKSSTFSRLSSPKPRTRRKNHLRPKLPIRIRQPEPDIPKLPIVVQEPAQKEETIEPIQPVELVQELAYQSQNLEPLPNPNPIPIDRPFILDLSLRFAALLAVQTVAAAWILGRGVKRGEQQEEEEKARVGVGVFEEEKVMGEIEGNKMGEESDLERAVSEIREMARAARVQEVKERELERSEIEKERLGFAKAEKKEDLSGGKVGSRKRLGIVRSNVRRKGNVGKGFGGVKKVEEGNNGVGDGKISFTFLLYIG